ncbi:BglG family transcription antiterminator [Shouchella shacheensis]|uniref:BglG family transcription antiterminator n=1 Tax=Shouchella shacheensis TaxID=1649580 RepID=UPI0007404405|nr:PTS sugar transporter subunit IIA [Shouchella shacheensis]
MFSSRQKILLAKLLESSQYVTVEFLAKWQNVSERTIRYDLDAMDAVLKDMDLSLTRAPGKGVLLHVSKENRSVLFTLAEGNQISFDKRTQLTMITLFVVMQETVTIQQLADEFHLSRSSIQKYLPEVEEMLDRFDLHLTKVARKGFQVNGTERSLRRALYHLLTDKQVDLEKAEGWLTLEKLADNELLLQWLHSCQEERGVYYSETSLHVLYIFLGWWYNHILSGHYVFVPQNQREKKAFHLGEVGRFLTGTIDDSRVLEHECAFLDNLFDQAKIVSYKKNANQWGNYHKEKTFSAHLVEQISAVLQVDLTADEKLMNDLTYHIKSALLRIEQGVEIDNPYTEEIKVKYRAIYEMVHQITSDMGYSLLAAEIAFITMHISAGFDRSNSRKFAPTVIVVCSTGLATSSILTTKLSQVEPGFRLISVVNTEDLAHELEERDVDFVLTTQELNMNPWYQKKTFRVSPLLNDDDKRTIQHEAQKIVNRKQLALFNQVYASASAVEPTLFDETVHSAKTSEWRESVSLAAQPLLQQGYIRQGYIQEMIMSVERNGTYMVLLPKIAFVHASPENVIKEGISMTVFDEEIDFGSFNPERVKIIIVLAIKEAHNQDFLQLFRYLESPEVRDRLSTKTSGGKKKT